MIRAWAHTCMIQHIRVVWGLRLHDTTHTRCLGSRITSLGNCIRNLEAENEGATIMARRGPRKGEVPRPFSGRSVDGRGQRTADG
jgi:hypothetical protein